ncbi:COX4, subunit IV of cytochrome c oxidase [Rickenella mellea]|uniref:COX4, subunit IV of cytochrome c oxidase n=1 Tax=Rickenella mellea TaxID=50990 RepID=A0A4Y7QI55_9AGAM|nr:COX4, subunit IV of cytochrome c oxidase [Rickenella mellea]
MQAIRLARPRAPIASHLRRLATAAAPTSGLTQSSASTPSIIPLSNVEAQWEKLSTEEQVAVHQQLEQLQKKDWKELSIDEKKAAYYISFGPHGPRTPVSPPGQGYKILFALALGVGATGLLFEGLRTLAAPPPRTLTKEWQEASNDLAKERKLNPISGISSDDYKGKGFVTASK